MAAKTQERFIELSPEMLSPEALQGLLEEFVTRDGTDYGAVERSVEDKMSAVHQQIRSGEARIVFDTETESTTVVVTRDLPDTTR